MLIDKELQYSDAQAVTASARSTNVVDHGEARELGTGETMYHVVAVTTAMTDSSSNSTITATLETDSDEAFGSPTLAVISHDVFAALAAAGTQRMRQLPVGGVNERYSATYYTTANGDLTTGSFDAFLCHGVHKWKAYADNVTIS
jgi:hypothetical protein